MRRIIEISASFTGKISTGQFENESPYFSAKETIDVDDFADGLVIDIDKLIEERQSDLKSICYEQFKKHATIAYQEKIAKTYQNIRFYDAGNGEKYPSVTSIINMDENFFVTPDELAQSASRGTIIHKQVEEFLKTGVWPDYKSIPELAPHVMTVVKGSLGLLLDDVSFVNFYKDYPFKVLLQEGRVINPEHKYAGRFDILCIIEKSNPGKWDKVEGVQFDVNTLLDIKTGSSLDKTKGFTQQSAYAKALDNVAQIGLIHLTKENQCGFAKPSLTAKIESYWNIFLNKRVQFNQRYGI